MHNFAINQIGKGSFFSHTKIFSLKVRTVFFICFAFLLSLLSSKDSFANPFFIDFQAKENLTNEDYIEVQQKLRSIDIMPLLQGVYPSNKGLSNFDDFKGRCTRGMRQTLIDPSRNFFPSQHIEKIGKGGDACFVCCVPYDGIYPSLVKSIIQALKETGFNGYYLYQMGGFPNPTGKEIQYAGVPYSFKIFMMLEAKKRGFNRVIWIDSSMFPLRDPTPLFERLDKKGACINGWKTPSDAWKYILPSTRQLLQDLTGTDVLNATYINTMVFGLRMDTHLAQKLVDTYYELVQRGTPFLSCFPEEFVLTAIIGQPDYKGWKPFKEKLLNGDKDMEKVRKKKYFFYLRKH